MKTPAPLGCPTQALIQLAERLDRAAGAELTEQLYALRRAEEAVRQARETERSLNTPDAEARCEARDLTNRAIIAFHDQTAKVGFALHRLLEKARMAGDRQTYPKLALVA